MRALTQKAAAWLLGIRPSTLRHLDDAPRNQDGSYDARELVAWQIARHSVVEDHEEDLEADEEELGAGGKAEAAEELTRWRAIRERWKHERELGRWVPIQSVRASQSALQQTLAQTSEKLARECGDDAQRIFDRGVDQAFEAARRELREAEAGE